MPYIKALTYQLSDLKSHSLLFGLGIPFDQIAHEVEKQFTNFGNCDRTNVLIETLCYIGYFDDNTLIGDLNLKQISPKKALNFTLASYTKTVTKLQVMKCLALLDSASGSPPPTCSSHLQSYRNHYEVYGYLKLCKSTGLWRFLVKEFDSFTFKKGQRMFRRLPDRSNLIMKFSLECKRAGIDIIELENGLLLPREVTALTSDGIINYSDDYECDLRHRTFQSLKQQ